MNIEVDSSQQQDSNDATIEPIDQAIENRSIAVQPGNRFRWGAIYCNRLGSFAARGRQINIGLTLGKHGFS